MYRCHGVCCGILIVCVFFFKQKTAYEMRISDWSSDVCSSDLLAQEAVALGDRVDDAAVGEDQVDVGERQGLPLRVEGRVQSGVPPGIHALRVLAGDLGTLLGRQFGIRSEEHTSELQSLMRISYAVFCLKKKNQY